MDEKTKKWVKPLLFLLSLLAGAVILIKVFDTVSEQSHEDPVNQVHSEIEKCQVCHQPIDEVRPQNCARSGCHTSNYFRQRMEQTDSPLTQHIRRDDCLKCHTEHHGKEGELTLPFEHTKAMADQCGDCHMMPDKHPDTADTCRDCHVVESFKQVKKGS